MKVTTVANNWACGGLRVQGYVANVNLFIYDTAFVIELGDLDMQTNIDMIGHEITNLRSLSAFAIENNKMLMQTDLDMKSQNCKPKSEK